ncbi:MAG: sigma-70 family RNA polymerase sigma factor [Acidimicrobiia bacterium]
MTRSDDLTGERVLDLDDFERLYDSTAGPVMRYFFRRTGSAETAADLTAETFATALMSLSSYRPSRGSPRQWLFGIARNQLSRYLRWRRVDSRARKRLGMHPQVDLDSESRDRIEDLIDLKERIGQLDQALDTLSPKLALAVNLRVGHQLAYSEVAHELGISEATARARVSRGLAQLAEALEEEL